MKNHTFKKLLLALFVSLLHSAIMAQGQQEPPASPPATATGKIGDAMITVSYSSPSVRGRDVWDPAGNLAAYGKPWRAGANNATTFETDAPVRIKGNSLPAGKYSIYAIPGEKNWIWVFNSKIPGWGILRTGEVDTDPTSDVFRVTVKPKKSATMNERLVYEVTTKGLVLRWENVEVLIPIK